MTRSVRNGLAGLICVGLLSAGGGWGLQAADSQATKTAVQKPKKEPHPVLQNSIRQIEAIKDRLQKAPTDFGGHKEAAIDALNHAANELQQAIQFDKH